MTCENKYGSELESVKNTAELQWLKQAYILLYPITLEGCSGYHR